MTDTTEPTEASPAEAADASAPAGENAPGTPSTVTSPAGDRDYHERADPHRTAPKLAMVILGGQDGLVNTLGVLLGVAAASNDTRVVLAAGLAATFAESISMGAVMYTSTLADIAHFDAELAREKRHIRVVPGLERDEIREMYRRKGFDGELLDRIVDTITSNEEVWTSVMMAEEHQLVPVTRRDAIRWSVLVFASAMIGSLIPLMPFFFLAPTMAIWTSIAFGSLTLFGVGVYKARTRVGAPMRSGLEMAGIGLLSALVGYGIGLLFTL